MTPTKPHFTPGNVIAHSWVPGAKFRHMGPGDVRVWVKATELSLIPGERFDYNVRLGGSGAESVDRTHEHYGMWLTLMCKRVDVVAWVAGQPWLIEVKPIGSFAALGQALGYCDLWEREKGNKPKPVPCVVCAYADPDLIETFERYGVRVISLPMEVRESCLEPSHRAGRWSGT